MRQHDRAWLVKVAGIAMAGFFCLASPGWSDSIGISFSHDGQVYAIGKNIPLGYKDSWQAGTTDGNGTFRVRNLSVTTPIRVRLYATDASPRKADDTASATNLTWILSTTQGDDRYRLWWAQTGSGGNPTGAKPTTWTSIRRYYDTTPTTLAGFVKNDSTGVIDTSATVSDIPALNSLGFDLQIQMANDVSMDNAVPTDPRPADHYNIAFYIAIDTTQAAVATKWFYSPTANAYFANIGNETIYDIHEANATGNRTWNRNSFETTINSTDYANLYADGIIQYVDVVWSTYWDDIYTSSNAGYCGHTYIYTRRWYYNVNGTWNAGARYTTQGGSYPRWVKSLVGPQ